MAILQRAVAVLLVTLAVVSTDGIGPSSFGAFSGPSLSTSFSHIASIADRQNFLLKSASSSSCGGEIIVVSQADANTGPISSCTEIHGDIILDNAVGNISFPVQVPGAQLTSIYGSVYCRNNTALEGLELYGLTYIEDSITVQNAASLVYVAAEQLESVESVTVTNVPSLQTLDLPILAYMQSLEIGDSPMSADNFGEGFFRLESVGDLYIHDCPNMSIPLVTPLQNITNSLVVENNGLDFEIYSDLLWVYNMTLRNVRNFQLNSLVAINISLEISSCGGLTDIDFPSLKSMRGDFYVENNPNLTLLSVPSATNFGSFTSQNNPGLQGFNFESLRDTTGGIYLDGPWRSLADLNISFPVFNSASGGIIVVFNDEPGAGQGQAPPIECIYAKTYAPRTWSSAFSCNGTVPKPKSSHGMSLNVKDGIIMGGVAIIFAIAVLVL